MIDSFNSSHSPSDDVESSFSISEGHFWEMDVEWLIYYAFLSALKYPMSLKTKEYQGRVWEFLRSEELE